MENASYTIHLAFLSRLVYYHVMYILAYLRKHALATIIILLILWIVSGKIFGNREEAVPLQTGNATLPTVSIVKTVAEPHTRTISVQGRTEANRTLELRAQIEAKVISINVKEGAKVKRGAIIMKLEDVEPRAQLREAEATVKQREIEFNAAKKLLARGFEAETRFAQSKARLEEARAQRTRAAENLERTVIHAPFDGVVEQINAETGDIIRAFDVKALATFLELDPIVISGQISESLVRDLSIGSVGKVTLINGESIDAVIRFIGTSADPNTRTYRVELEAPNTDLHIRAGSTASIELPVQQGASHFVPLSALSLSGEGVVGVKIIDNPTAVQEPRSGIKGVVKFFPVTIARDESRGAWISGLPAAAYLITLGQAYVREGQEVLGLMETGNAP